MKPPRRTVGEILDRNWWCPWLVAQLIPVSASHQQHVALFKGNRVAHAVKAQPAIAPFHDVEISEISRREADRPRRRELTPTEHPSLQLERVQDVGQNVSPASVQEQR